ncbi:hypothetical protein SDC9_161134 [bioreactor metagenome]|uniref:Putative zinc-finger domain-containing protein n=1 Tax=bioreactor metagenome TaxID=1076179 RepID=A0A645FHD4_9ZZZZ
MKLPEISCEVCMDLIPLVQDGVASEDSTALVEQHIATCAACRAAMGQPVKPDEEGSRILVRIKRKFSWWLLLLILVGVIAGMSLQFNEMFAYNLIIMPFLGAAVYLWGQQKWYTMPLLLFVGGFLWQLFSLNFTGFADSFAESAALAGFIGFSYGALALLGTAVAALLRYAFAKEKQDEKEK